MLSMILGIIAAGAIIYTSVLYKSPPLAFLGYAAALLVVMAGLFLVYRAYTMHCSMELPISIAECGRPFVLHIIVDNRSFLPCTKFKCQIEQRNLFLKKKKKRWRNGNIAIRGINCYEDTIVIHNYGSYEISLKKIRIYDLTGLFYIQKKIKGNTPVQVFPHMQEVGVYLTEAVRNFFGDAEVYDDFRPGDDHSELFQIRQFQNGDKIQSVHWKLSAKLDDLYVKEDSLPKACPVVFFLDYRKGKQRKAEKVNVYLIVLASISFSLMDAGCLHYAAWYSNIRKDIIRVRIEDEESLYLFLSCYLGETFEQWEGNLLEAYREKYKGENYLHELYLDQALELQKNKEMIAKFEGRDWKKKLENLELII